MTCARLQVSMQRLFNQTQAQLVNMLAFVSFVHTMSRGMKAIAISASYPSAHMVQTLL